MYDTVIRNGILLAGFLCAFIQCPSVNADIQQQPKRPNIIFVMADDQRENTYSAAGHPILKTPNIDWLAHNGVRFSNTYTAAPVCSPSRTSFLTGMYERKHGIGFGSAYQLTEEQWLQTYPALMQSNGYKTAFIGKIGIEYYTFRAQIASKFDHWYGHNGWTAFFPKKYPDYPSTLPYLNAEKDIITEIMSDGIREYLNKAAEDKEISHKPFILSVSLSTPHDSQAHSMGASDFKRAPSSENAELTNHPIYDKLFRDGSIAAHEDTGRDPYKFLPKNILDHSKGRARGLYSVYYKRDTNKEAHVRYFQMIQGIDKLMGEMIETLRVNNQLDNTVIIFSSDHGLHMGENGFGGKSLLTDVAAKIPFLLYDPRLTKKKRGQTIDKLISSLDITSTMLAYGNTEESEHMQGNSVLPLIDDNNAQWRDEIYLESLMSWRDNPIQEGVRKGDWKYIRYFRGNRYKTTDGGMGNYMVYKEEDLDFSNQTPIFESLVNLKDDPLEKVNLITNMKDSKTLQELRDKTKKYSEQQVSERIQFKKSVNTALREPY